jgi:hypothetical protein
MISDIQLRNAYAELVEGMGDDMLPFSAIAPEARGFVDSSLDDLECFLYKHFSPDERALVRHLLYRSGHYERCLALFAVARALAEPFWLARADSAALDIVELLWGDMLGR